jgi:sulfatase maturation enzyme AslB (radical SAM superfamily)
MSYSKFEHPEITAKGEQRASVELDKLETLWFNTGTLCNLACTNCYIESGPRNDRLAFLNKSDVEPYMQEIKNDQLATSLIGFTGGEPFINPNIIEILDLTLSYGIDSLVLTNATNILKKHHISLLELKGKYGDQLKLRVSLDHYTKDIHERERGVNTFDKCLDEMKWLFVNGFHLSIAGRSLMGEPLEQAIEGYQNLIDTHQIKLNLKDDNKIVIFPEMIQDENVPEITVDCWEILNKTPQMQMCSNERMIVKRKGQESAVVVACTLLAYDEQFELGKSLKTATKRVCLNHAFCSKFCVLGGASCSSTN